jgi:hypothetical protein
MLLSPERRIAVDLRAALIQRLDEARSGLESLFPRVDTARQIYPNWTLKQMLDHIAGWDDAVIASLHSHMNGSVSATPADRGIDFYNAETVTTREGIDFGHTLQEFHASRHLLKQAILSMSDEKLVQPLTVPWGSTGTVSEVIEVFADHEEIHTADILRWLQNPEQIIMESKA